MIDSLKALIAKPIAHGGLHNCTEGIIEHSPSAVLSAIYAGWGIQVDLRPTASNMPVIFPDATLEHVTNGQRQRVCEFGINALKKLRYKDSDEQIQTLPEFLEQVNGAVPILLDIKTGWGSGNGWPMRIDRRLEEKTCQILKNYSGAYAVMSFDPVSIQAVRYYDSTITCGLASRLFKSADDCSCMTAKERFSKRHLLPALFQKVDFIVYDVDALPALAPWLARCLFGKPLFARTVRTQAVEKIAKNFADAIIFENFKPKLFVE